MEITGQGRLPALYGLAVGIGPYKDPSLDLEFGDDNARAVAAVLKKATAQMFREVAVKPLVDQDASLAVITAAFETMAARAGRRLCTFSGRPRTGHGRTLSLHPP